MHYFKNITTNFSSCVLIGYKGCLSTDNLLYLFIFVKQLIYYCTQNTKTAQNPRINTCIYQYVNDLL